MANKQDFIAELNDILIQVKALNIHSIEIVSQDLHDRTVSKVPNNTPTHRMSSCSKAMEDITPVNFKKSISVNSTDSGQSNTICKRYYL